jgi:hypothetical protein
LSAAGHVPSQIRLNSLTMSVVLAAAGRSLAAVRSLRSFSTANARSEFLVATACSLSAFCLLTSFSTARVQALLGAVPRPIWSLVAGKSRLDAAAGAFAPANTNRRSMSWQAGHKKVRCSNPGRIVGSARTASIRTISVLHTKHRIALNHSFSNETYGAWGAKDVQACPHGCSQHLAVCGHR